MPLHFEGAFLLDEAIKLQFKKSDFKNSVTFYGGTFRPFHRGHLECLHLCPEDNILIIPDRNPQKEEHAFCSGDEIFALAKLLKDTPYSIYPGFYLLNNKNPTAHWISKVSHREINFLMGDDSYMNLMSWIDVAVFLKSLTKLYVVPRHFNKNDYDIVALKCLKLNPRLNIIYLKEHVYQDVSSSKLRTK